jgi:hypothetical protein
MNRAIAAASVNEPVYDDDDDDDNDNEPVINTDALGLYSNRQKLPFRASQRTREDELFKHKTEQISCVL